MRESTLGIVEKLYWTWAGLVQKGMALYENYRVIEHFTSNLNVLASIFDYIVVRNNTGSILTTYTATTRNHRVVSQLEKRINIQAGITGITFEGSSSATFERRDEEPAQMIYMHKNKGAEQRISLVKSPSYFTVVAFFPDDEPGEFVIAKDVAVRKGRLYKIAQADYNMALESHRKKLQPKNTKRLSQPTWYDR